MEVYKKQVTELQVALNEETNKMEKLEFETKKLYENLNTLQKEKEVSISIFSFTLFLMLHFYFRD